MLTNMVSSRLDSLAPQASFDISDRVQRAGLQFSIQYSGQEAYQVFWQFTNHHTGEVVAQASGVNPEIVINQTGFVDVWLRAYNRDGFYQDIFQEYVILIAPALTDEIFEIDAALVSNDPIYNDEKVGSAKIIRVFGKSNGVAIRFQDLNNKIIWFDNVEMSGNNQKGKLIHLENVTNCWVDGVGDKIHNPTRSRTKITNMSPWGINISNHVQDVTIFGFELHESSFAGIRYDAGKLHHKTNVARELDENPPKNLRFFDIHGFDIKSELFYINHNNGFQSDYESFPPYLDGLLITRCTGRNIGGDLFQWSASKNVEICWNETFKQTTQSSRVANNVFSANENCEGYIHHNLGLDVRGFLISAKNFRPLIFAFNIFPHYTGNSTAHDAIQLPGFNADDVPEYMYQHQKLFIYGNTIIGWLDRFIQDNNQSPGYPKHVFAKNNLVSVGNANQAYNGPNPSDFDISHNILFGLDDEKKFEEIGLKNFKSNAELLPVAGSEAAIGGESLHGKILDIEIFTDFRGQILNDKTGWPIGSLLPINTANGCDPSFGKIK